MSEDQKPDVKDLPNQFTYIEAPLTFWELLRRARVWIVALVILGLLFIFPVEVQPDILPPIACCVASLAVAYHLFKDIAGLSIDIREIGDGYVKFKELTKHELDELTGPCVTLSSTFGPLVVQGHALFSESGAHSRLEVALNSYRLQEIEEFQQEYLLRFMALDEGFDTQVTKGVLREWMYWKEKLRIRTSGALPELEKSVD